MKVIGFDQYGDVSVLQEKEVAVPTISPTQVLIRTKYVSIHPVDSLIRSGGFSSGPLTHFLVPGSEVLGEITEMGAEVKHFNIGDIVIGKVMYNAYAEYVAVEQAKAFLKPDHMNEEMAAGFSGVGITAYYSLFDYGQMKAGETIVILGASGGVGTIAVQMAKDAGLYVIALASEKNKEYVLSLGADEFVDYRDEIQMAAIHNRADLVVDASLFASSVDAGLAFAKDGARYVTLTRSPAQPKDKKVEIMDMRRTAAMTEQRAMDYLFDLHARKGLIIKPTTTFPFTAAGAREAHTALNSGQPSKKYLLKA